MKIRAVIVDDEPRAHKIIESYASRIQDMEIVSGFMNAVSAYSFLKDNHVDLIFLDISMPEVDGFAFLRMMSKPPMVIFTTAHPEFALESYDYNAVDYLKKPIPFERFSKAIAKVTDLLSSKQTAPEVESITLKVDGDIRIILFNKIRYFQSLGNYIKIFTDDKVLLTQMTTQDLEKELPKSLFIRIHKSFIVNRARIEGLKEDEVILSGISLPVGKTFKRYVQAEIQRQAL